MRRAVLLAIAALLALAPAARAGADTVDYVVQPGDTCIRIATSVLGDRNQYTEIHRLNPQLGALPHNLRPGQILKLPRRDHTETADARLTGAQGEVKVRKATDVQWGKAERGMDLFRAWRVGAEERASAELTFHDDSRLRMREKTIVIVYGPEAAVARTITASASLEQGTLESRLGELGGNRIAIHTSSADAELAGGRALVTVAGDGASIVAVHDGRPVAVRGKGTPGATRAVAVAVGMGSKVHPGKPPDPPRALPSTPSWITPATTFASFGGRASIHAEWSAVPAAATYRVAIEDARGEPVSALAIAAPATRFDAADLAPGTYHVTVAAIDGDGFESAPSTPLALGLVAISVDAPANATLAAYAPGPDQPLSLAIGTSVVAPDGGRCAAGPGEGRARTTLVRPGPTTIACTTQDGTPIAAVPVLVLASATAVTPTIARGALVTVAVPVYRDDTTTEPEVAASRGLRVVTSAMRGDQLLVELAVAPDAPTRGRVVATAAGDVVADQAVDIVDAPVVPVPHVRHLPRLELGGFVGEHVFIGGQDALDLGRPRTADYELASGPGLGLRAGLIPTTHLGGEVELGVIQTHYAAAAGDATIVSGRARLAVILPRGDLGLRLLAGIGVHALVGDSPGTKTDSVPFADLGLAATWAVSARTAVRLDARDELGPGLAGGVAHGIELGLGFSIAIDR